MMMHDAVEPIEKIKVSRNGTTLNGHARLRVVRILESAGRSLAGRGRLIEFDPQQCAV
jgi:hypothetical protein